jgi:hypothetical protein
MAKFLQSAAAALTTFFTMGFATVALADSSNRSTALSNALNAPVNELVDTPLIAAPPAYGVRQQSEGLTPTTPPAYGVRQQIEGILPGPGFGQAVSDLASQNGSSASAAANQQGVLSSAGSNGRGRR